MSCLKDFSNELDVSTPGWRADYQQWRQGKAKGAKGEGVKLILDEEHGVDERTHLLSASVRRGQRATTVDNPLNLNHGHMFSFSYALSTQLGQVDLNEKDRVSDTSKMSTRATMASFITAMVGSSMLAMPRVAAKAGIVMGPLIVMLVGAMLCQMGKLICQSAKDAFTLKGTAITKFEDLAEALVGNAGKYIVRVTSNCALTGFVTIMMVLMGQSLETLFPVVTYKVWLVILMPLNICFAVMRDMSYFAKLAFLGIVACAFCIGIQFSTSIQAVMENRQWDPAYRTWGQQHDVPRPMYSLGPESFLSIGSCFAVAFYSFAVLVSIPTVRSQMQEPEDLPMVLNVSFGVCTLANAGALLVGYWGFGNHVTDSVLQCLKADRVGQYWTKESPWEEGNVGFSAQMLAVALIVNMVCSYPIYQQCIALAIESNVPALQSSTVLRTAMRVVLGISIVLMAVLVPFFLQIIGVVASMFCTTNNVFLPICFFHLAKRRLGQQVGALQLSCHILALALGVLVFCVGLSSAIMELITKANDEPELANPLAGWVA